MNGVAIDEPPLTVHASERAGLFYPGFGDGRCAFLSVDGSDPVHEIEELLDAGAADFVVAVDAGVDLRDVDSVLFHWTANADPGRDLVVRGHRIGFDATRKTPGAGRHGHPVRDYPPPLEMDAAMREKVTRRWTEYGF